MHPDVLSFLPFLPIFPFLVAFVVGALPAAARRLSAVLAGGAMLAAGVATAALAPAVFAGAVPKVVVPWLAGIDYAVRVDGLAWIFCLLISAIGVLVVLYAHYYLSADDSEPRFLAYLLAFAGAMLGVVTAGNLIALLVFWELTSVASFLLIGFWTHRDDARQGARMALTITAGGGLCLLAGLILLGQVVGSFDLDAVLAAGPQVRADPLYPAILALILLGAFTKSAQFPFHFWLPHAMAAPTPVSAFLHSATMVKAGVFLLARLYPVLAGSEAWFYAVSLAGLATLLVGAWYAVFQHDLKGLLAYSTLSHLGLITLLLGLGSELAVVAAVFHILNHATFKASLFMAAGIIDHECGTRDLRRINGLIRYMPWTSVLAMTAAAAMAGVPLLNGFLSKEMFFAEALQVSHPLFAWLVPTGAVLAGLLGVAYSTRFIHDTFFHGEPVGLDRHPHEPPLWMRVPVDLLVLVCVVVGLLPMHTFGPLLAVAVPAVSGAPMPDVSIALWHGFNLPLAMSAVAFVGGIGLYFRLQRERGLHGRDPSAGPSGQRGFERAMSGLAALAGRVTRVLQHGSLPGYGATLLAAAGLALLPWLTVLALPAPSGDVDPGLAAGALLVALAALACVLLVRRLPLLLASGIAGLGAVLIFLSRGAPDLAFTQLAVDGVFAVVVAAAIGRLTASAPTVRPHGRPGWAALAAVATGVALTVLALGMTAAPFDAALSDFFGAQSLVAAHGRNVVNVIIVDFRGLDTLGEIAVVLLAALAAVGILQRIPRGAR